VVISLEQGADCLHNCAPADATASQNPTISCLVVLPFWYRLTQVVLEKRPLNGCSSLVVVINMTSYTGCNLVEFSDTCASFAVAAYC